MIYKGKSGIKILLKKSSAEIDNMVLEQKHRCKPIIDMLCKSYFEHDLLNIFTKIKKQPTADEALQFQGLWALRCQKNTGVVIQLTFEECDSGGTDDYHARLRMNQS